MKKTALCLLLSLTADSVLAWHDDQLGGVQPSYSDLEIEDLMDLSITSVSKHQEKISRAAAAVYVLTAPDLKNSGVTTLPQALRLVPGMEVAQINGAQYEISTRGARDLFANKLLVLVDGRSIYSQLFSGVQWEMQQIPIEAIDRIEVIRGPGGALWGSNAVNGVINVVTKSAAQMQGGQLSGVLGERQRFGSLSYGSQLNEKGYHRSYYQKVRDDLSVPEANQHDFQKVDWRMDQMLSGTLNLMLNANLYNGSFNYDTVRATAEAPYASLFNPHVSIKGGFINSELKGGDDASQNWQLQLYLEHYERDYEWLLNERQRIADLSWQQRIQLSSRQALTWGAGVRGNWDQFDDSLTVQLQPLSQYNLIQQAFIQDQIRQAGDRAQLTLGTKLEHHRFDGSATLPTIRFAYALTPESTVWVAASQAVQMPSRSNRSLTYLVDYAGQTAQYDLPVLVGLRPGKHIKPEKLTAYEAGYRVRLTDQWNLDASAFRQRYRDFRVSAPEPAAFSTREGFSFLLAGPSPGGQAEAFSTGFDLILQWIPGPSDRWLLGYSYLNFSIDDLSGNNPQAELQAQAEPQHMWTLQQFHSFNEKWQLFTHVHYVSTLPYDPPAWPSVAEYWATDLSLRYQIEKELAVGLIGRNLFDPDHYETTLVFGQSKAVEVARSVALTLDWRF